MNKNIGIVSTRLAGLDGVSLEARKWADVLESSGHSCFWFAGELDTAREKCFLVPEAHFQHPQNIRLNEQIFGKLGREASVTETIHATRSHLKAKLKKFVDQFKIDFLIVENALAIPLNIPFGIALAELISETQLPTIAHHHDFFWERTNLLVNAVGEYVGMAFPPCLPNIEHVVINSLAREELARRKGIQASIIPNVLDFDNPPLKDKKDPEAFRAMFDLKPGDRAILQPTRIIKRKGIEHAVDLVKALSNPNYKLLLSHEPGDEGSAYPDWIMYYARENGVDLRISKSKIISPWNNGDQYAGFSLWNVYMNTDLVTFPSTHEGFGNAFLEAVYFKKPMMVNRYATFVTDIEPKGFDLVAIDGHLTRETIQMVREILESPHRSHEMVHNNYETARQNYSYGSLKKQLSSVLEKLSQYKSAPVYNRDPAPSQYACNLN